MTDTSIFPDPMPYQAQLLAFARKWERVRIAVGTPIFAVVPALLLSWGLGQAGIEKDWSTWLLVIVPLSLFYGALAIRRIACHMLLYPIIGLVAGLIGQGVLMGVNAFQANAAGFDLGSVAKYLLTVVLAWSVVGLLTPVYRLTDSLIGTLVRALSSVLVGGKDQSLARDYPEWSRELLIGWSGMYVLLPFGRMSADRFFDIKPLTGVQARIARAFARDILGPELTPPSD